MYNFKPDGGNSLKNQPVHSTLLVITMFSSLPYSVGQVSVFDSSMYLCMYMYLMPGQLGILILIRLGNIKRTLLRLIHGLFLHLINNNKCNGYKQTQGHYPLYSTGYVKKSFVEIFFYILQNCSYMLRMNGNF
jgi:hypothetical protein